MKKILLYVKIILVLCIAISLIVLVVVGCSKQSKQIPEEEKTKMVAVEVVKEESYPNLIRYIGILTSTDVKKYAFKTGGKVGEINIKIGQEVKKGDVIASLDRKDLLFEVEGAETQMQMAEAQYDKAVNGAETEDINAAKLDMAKAQDAYDFASDTYDKMLKMYERGFISKLELDQAKLNMNTASNGLQQAKEMVQKAEKGARPEDIKAARAQYKAAKVGYDARMSLLEDATLYADADGYVVDVLGEEGELIAQGYPIAIIRTNRQIVQVGLSQKDVKKVQVDTKAKIIVDDMVTEGIITNINQTPDQESRTYTVEVEVTKELPQQDFYLGSIAHVDFEIGDKRGVWVDIASVMNDGEDYVYVIKDHRAVRKTIQLMEVYEDKISVEGLMPGEQLVVGGMKGLKEGYKVTISE